MSEAKVCMECGKEKPLKCFIGGKNPVPRPKSGKLFMRARNICSACCTVRHNARLKISMLKAFDWKCQCCGEGHPDFLTLQHVTGKGRTLGKRASVMEKLFAQRHGWDPEHFSVYCYNCNCAKQYYGKCPHETGETVQVGIDRLLAKGTKKRYFVSERFKLLNAITEDQIRKIASLKSSGRTQRSVADEYKTSHQVVGCIWSDKPYKGVQVN